MKAKYPEYIFFKNLQFNNKMIQLKNGQKTWIDIFPKMKYKWPISTWKKYSTSLAIMEIQIKTTVSFDIWQN